MNIIKTNWKISDICDKIWAKFFPSSEHNLHFQLFRSGLNLVMKCWLNQNHGFVPAKVTKSQAIFSKVSVICKKKINLFHRS